MISGWNEVASRWACRTATILPIAGPEATVATTSTPAPTFSTQGARMNIARNDPEDGMAADVEVRLEGVHLAAERVAADHHVEAAEGLLAGDPRPRSGRRA